MNNEKTVLVVSDKLKNVEHTVDSLRGDGAKVYLADSEAKALALTRGLKFNVIACEHKISESLLTNIASEVHSKQPAAKLILLCENQACHSTGTGTLGYPCINLTLKPLSFLN